MLCKDWKSVLHLSLDLAVLSAKTEHRLVHEITKLNVELHVISHLLDIIFSFICEFFEKILAILNASLVRIDEVLIVTTNIIYLLFLMFCKNKIQYVYH